MKCESSNTTERRQEDRDKYIIAMIQIYYGFQPFIEDATGRQRFHKVVYYDFKSKHTLCHSSYALIQLMNETGTQMKKKYQHFNKTLTLFLIFTDILKSKKTFGFWIRPKT